jgi:DNA-binding LytR/AlgR family response regulator
MVSVASSEGDVLVGQNKPQLFILENENGKQILKVATTDLICFEANDNYVITYYLNKEGQVKKTMDRFSLKKIDDLLKSAGIAFERVHKSFIVNPDYILKIKGKAQAYKLEIKHLDTEVPVSRSYDISTLKP